MSERERWLFDLNSVKEALDGNLSEGLRAIADAIECGDVDGFLWNVIAHGFGKPTDTRARLRISFEIAADLVEWRDGKRHWLPHPTIALPVPERPRTSSAPAVDAGWVP